jgi:hypothetical protein
LLPALKLSTDQELNLETITTYLDAIFHTSDNDIASKKNYFQLSIHRRTSSYYNIAKKPIKSFWRNSFLVPSPIHDCFPHYMYTMPSALFQKETNKKESEV